MKAAPNSGSKKTLEHDKTLEHGGFFGDTLRRVFLKTYFPRMCVFSFWESLYYLKNRGSGGGGEGEGRGGRREGGGR
jgi:hypothetical protein